MYLYYSSFNLSMASLIIGLLYLMSTVLAIPINTSTSIKPLADAIPTKNSNTNSNSRLFELNTVSTTNKNIDLQFMHNPGARPPWQWNFNHFADILNDSDVDDEVSYDDDDNDELSWPSSPLLRRQDEEEKHLENFPMLTADSDDSEIDLRHYPLQRRALFRWYPMTNRNLFIHHHSQQSDKDSQASNQIKRLSHANQYYRNISPYRRNTDPHDEEDIVEMVDASPVPTTAEVHLTRRSGGTQRFLLGNTPSQSLALS
ncbi:hypothetical protein BDF19DRAFT_446140 [Syncephalis fuscata]|nr:hypothetical protein BDF19DRAFT_446140 [Syncephalis fuscata]